MKPCVFLDRDGTLVRDVGYPHKLEDYELLPGVVPALLRLMEAGFVLGVVTNQSGIGRGYYAQADFERFHGRLLQDLDSGGVSLVGTWWCPHAPADRCACRKPEPGLLYQARDTLGIRLAESWLIGDAASDVGAARNAGCAGAIRLIDSPLPERLDPLGLQATDIAAAAALLIDVTNA